MSFGFEAGAELGFAPGMGSAIAAGLGLGLVVGIVWVGTGFFFGLGTLRLAPGRGCSSVVDCLSVCSVSHRAVGSWSGGSRRRGLECIKVVRFWRLQISGGGGWGGVVVGVVHVEGICNEIENA